MDRTEMESLLKWNLQVGKFIGTGIPVTDIANKISLLVWNRQWTKQIVGMVGNMDSNDIS